MRANLFELSVTELKERYINETKALVFALEAGVHWEDLQYVRESIKDLTKCIDAKTPPTKFHFRSRNVDILPPFFMSPDFPL
jgi:CheY-specific phosphatase CheX